MCSAMWKAPIREFRMQEASGVSEAPIVDPFGVPYTLRLCEAIERLTASLAAADRASFRAHGANLRYAVERHLFFALVGDRALYRQFVAASQQAGQVRESELSEVAALIAPYLLGTACASPPAERLSWRAWFASIGYRRMGEAQSTIEGLDGQKPRVLFVITQPKFVTYLRPIAEALPAPYAFLAIDDPGSYEWMAERALPRMHVQLTAESNDLTRPRVMVGRHEYRAKPFEYFAIRYNAIRKALERNRPDCIVVPEGNAPVYELINRAAAKLRIPTLCVQQGWSPIVHSGFRNMSYTRMCVWGRGFADFLAPYNPRQRFVVTGNHVLTCRDFSEGPPRSAIAFFLQRSHLITHEAWSRLLAMIQWASGEFPHCEIRVRQHPGAPLSLVELDAIRALPNTRLMPPDEETLDETLLGCRVAIAVYSTTILEAAATGAVPLIVNVAGLPHYHPDIAAEGAAIEVGDFDNAKSALRHLVLDDNGWEKFASQLNNVRRRYFASNRNEALTALVAQINALRQA
jgi:hypothetical protein